MATAASVCPDLESKLSSKPPSPSPEHHHNKGSISIVSIVTMLMQTTV